MRWLLVLALALPMPARACPPWVEDPERFERHDFVFPITTTCLPANPSIFVTGIPDIEVAGADYQVTGIGGAQRIDVTARRGTFELILDFGNHGLQRMLRVGCPFFPYARVTEIEDRRGGGGDCDGEERGEDDGKQRGTDVIVRVDSNASAFRVEYDGRRVYMRGDEALRLEWRDGTERVRVVALFVDGSERVVLDRDVSDDAWTRVVMSPWTWVLLLVGAMLVGVLLVCGPWPSRRRAFV